MNRRAFFSWTGVLLILLGLGSFATVSAAKIEVNVEPQKTETVEATPLPFVPGSWTIVILPDIQNYASEYPGLLRLQMQWILDHKKDRRIAYVLQTGDMTNHNNRKEWKRVDRAFRPLDSVAPYTIVPGNHDYRLYGRDGRHTLINDYFPPSRFEERPTFGGTMEPGRIENSYHLFEAGGKKWVVIGLEWGPRDTVLDWAGGILKKYADRKAIVLSHAYLYCDSTRHNWAAKGDSQEDNPHFFAVPGGVNDGEEMWNKLIKKYPNVLLMINGHIGGDGLGFEVSKADDGHRVNEMAVDYQRQDVGGGAWLRLLEFLPDGKTVQARSYSPLYDEYKTDSQNQFTFKID